MFILLLRCLLIWGEDVIATWEQDGILPGSLQKTMYCIDIGTFGWALH